ncbi:MAG: GNAT family N-acetyltransferase [Pseudomonadota bacterium]
MIRATAADRPGIEAALGARPELAMFPLDNLARYGMSGGHPRAMVFWVDDPVAPEVVLGRSEEGMVLPFAPDGLDVPACAGLLRGQPLKGFAGPAGPVRALIGALDLAGQTAELDADEPQFVLDLDRLIGPDGPGSLAPITEHRAVVEAWRTAYRAELRLGDPFPGSVAEEVEMWIAGDSHRVLVVDGRPAALTGFNARLPDIVQVGGVYTPPEARGRGLARRAVGLHLAEAREQGARRATLSAASEAAVACYRPLGFERIGEFALVLYDGVVTA